ncbi:MAG TPA: hypothetical protein VIL01_15310 [Thermomicrobiales bacterium]
MSEEQPPTKTVAALEARQNWSQLLDTVSRREVRVLVEEGSIPVATLVSTEDLMHLNRHDEKREQNFAILDDIGEAFKDVPAEEIEREVAKALAEVRA